MRFGLDLSLFVLWNSGRPYVSGIVWIAGIAGIEVRGVRTEEVIEISWDCALLGLNLEASITLSRG